MAEFEIVDDHTVVGADGRRHDVLEAIAELPWVDQLCPLMPHQYAHQSKADPLAYGVVEHMLKAANPGHLPRLLPRLPVAEPLLGRTRRPALLADQDDDQPLLA